MQPEGEIYVCLDEVQFFREWPLFVKAHHETKRVRFVVTGSNAAMLSTDIITLLSGRSLPLEVFPLSFRELSSYQKIKQMARFRGLLDELLEYGGFPLVALSDQKQTAYDVLGAHARTVLLQDVAPRLGLRKPAILEQLYVYLVSNIGKPFSYASLAKLFSLADKTIKEYLDALAGAHLLYEVALFSYSLKKQMRNPKKVYAIDTGQANAMGFRFSANHGRLLENLIFIDLKRHGLDIYYYRTKNDRAVDFVVKSGTNLSLVQVTWDLNDSNTREREIRAINETMDELNCSKATLIVAEPLRLRGQLGDGIQVLPAHKFLAMDPDSRRASLL